MFILPQELSLCQNDFPPHASNHHNLSSETRKWRRRDVICVSMLLLTAQPAVRRPHKAHQSDNQTIIREDFCMTRRWNLGRSLPPFYCVPPPFAGLAVGYLSSLKHRFPNRGTTTSSAEPGNFHCSTTGQRERVLLCILPGSQEDGTFHMLTINEQLELLQQVIDSPPWNTFMLGGAPKHVKGMAIK